MIIALTPSPALDRTVAMDGRLRPGSLNRVGAAREAAGGKGMNVVRAVTRLGGSAIAGVPLGGENGHTFRTRAATEGLELLWVEAQGETRCCTIVLHGELDHPTEINEPGTPVMASDWERLARLIADRRPDWVTVSGSLPAGTSPDELLDALIGAVPASRLAVDGGGSMLAAAVRAGVRMISPNRTELDSLCAVLEWQERGVRAARRVHQDFGTEVLLSDGSNGAGWFGPTDAWARGAAVAGGNPIASGDTLLGTLLWQLHGGSRSGEAPAGETRRLEVLRYAVAAATANVASGGGARITPQAVSDQLRHAEAWIVEE